MAATRGIALSRGSLALLSQPRRCLGIPAPCRLLVTPRAVLAHTRARGPAPINPTRQRAAWPTAARPGPRRTSHVVVRCSHRQGGRDLDEESKARASQDGREADDSRAGVQKISESHGRTDNRVTSARTAPEEKAQMRSVRVRRERRAYLAAAVVSSVSFMCLAAAAVVYRFVSQTQDGDVPYLEVMGTFALAVGAAVGMEFWARWAHKALWHGSLWHMHESHHRPRDGPFELNDIFAIINAGPAIGLLAYGFFFPGLFPGLCFGAGLGITMFGMAYMFVHDGLVHRRFAVGPVTNVPYLQKVAAAHQLHHADKFEGVPFGLFLGPQELVDVGGLEDLEKVLVSRRAGQR